MQTGVYAFFVVDGDVGQIDLSPAQLQRVEDVRVIEFFLQITRLHRLQLVVITVQPNLKILRMHRHHRGEDISQTPFVVARCRVLFAINDHTVDRQVGEQQGVSGDARDVGLEVALRTWVAVSKSRCAAASRVARPLA